MYRIGHAQQCECGTTAFCRTTQHGVAIVDSIDAEVLTARSYHMVCGRRQTPYARTGRKIGPLNGAYLHKLILATGPGEVIDHINGNGHDCRRSNLRICTQAQNTRNRKPHRNGTSGFLGVSYRRVDGVWIAQICVNGKNSLIGRFSSERDAAVAYDNCAFRFFGQFARLNFRTRLHEVTI